MFDLYRFIDSNSMPTCCGEIGLAYEKDVYKLVSQSIFKE